MQSQAKSSKTFHELTKVTCIDAEAQERRLYYLICMWDYVSLRKCLATKMLREQGYYSSTDITI